MGVFRIKADNFEWIGGAADDPQDLCLHGHVTVLVFVCSSRYCDIRLNKPPDDLEVDSEAGCKEAK